MNVKQMTVHRLDLEMAGFWDIKALTDEYLRAMRQLAEAQVCQGLSEAPDVGQCLRDAIAEALVDHWQPEATDIRDEIKKREGAL